MYSMVRFGRIVLAACNAHFVLKAANAALSMEVFHTYLTTRLPNKCVISSKVERGYLCPVIGLS